jgi:hypothetical protein
VLRREISGTLRGMRGDPEETGENRLAHGLKNRVCGKSEALTHD